MTDWGKRLKKYQPLTLNEINQENLTHITAYQDMVEQQYGTRPTVEEVVEAIFDKYANREHKIELEVPEFGKLVLKKINVDHVKLLEAACESAEKATGRKPELTVAADEYLTKFFARDGEYNEYAAKDAAQGQKKKEAKPKAVKADAPKAAVKEEAPKPAPATPSTPAQAPMTSTTSSLGFGSRSSSS